MDRLEAESLSAQDRQPKRYRTMSLEADRGANPAKSTKFGAGLPSSSGGEKSEDLIMIQ